MHEFWPGPIFLSPLQCEDIQASIVAIRPAHNASVQLLQDADMGVVVGGIAMRIISLPDRTYNVLCVRRQ